MATIWGELLRGIFMLPDYPNKRNPRAVWLWRNEQRLAIERLARNRRAEPRAVTLESAKRTFSSWAVDFIAILYAGTVLATYGYVYFGLFLKSLTNADGAKR